MALPPDDAAAASDGGVGRAAATRLVQRDGRIADRHFITQLTQARHLKTFLFEEKVKFTAEDVEKINFGTLNRIKYARYGRPPDLDEWEYLDVLFLNLANYLTDELRRKIRIRELRIFFRTLPLIFLTSSVVVSLLYFMLNDITGETAFRAFLYYVIVIAWAISQGGLGACAFLVTSVVVKNVQERGLAAEQQRPDPIDITDRNFLSARVLLGALFALLLGLPFARLSINNLMGPIVYAYAPDTTQILYALLPFLLGFSINLVLVILGRLLISIETFFGVANKT